MSSLLPSPVSEQFAEAEPASTNGAMPGHGEQASRDRLLQLLDDGADDDLDFKAARKLRDRQAITAIAKGVGTFSIRLLVLSPPPDKPTG